MAWNEPGGNKPKDPWGGGGDQGPPDLDEALKNLKDKINNVFGSKGGKSGGGGSSSGGGSPWPVLVIALVIVAIGYGLMGFFQVDQRERAVVLRFGKFDRIVEPGLNWRAPILEQYERDLAGAIPGARSAPVPVESCATGRNSGTRHQLGLTPCGGVILHG